MFSSVVDKGHTRRESVEMTGDEGGATPSEAPAPSRTSDELKPITALFADVVGSTSLGEKLAPDEVKALIGECVTRMAAAVEEFGGFVQAFMGDGICAYFGVPTAHEDDPERAARAALRIREDVATYAADVEAAWGISDFNVRVGINSGQTAVGLVGASDPQAVALGDTTNTAARLQSAADPGSIAVGEITARLLDGAFVLEEAGAVAVKGKAESVPFWRLIEARTSEHARSIGRLFGRDGEIQILKRAADDLVDGRGQVVAISGDPGLGKTRMMGELHNLLGDRATWLEGRCLSYGGELPYWPFVQTVRDWLGVRDGEADIAVRTKLRAHLQPLMGAVAEEVLPYLAKLLSLPGDPKQKELFDSLDRAELNARIGGAYVTWIEAMCTSKPVALALDDAHWIDPASQEVLTQLLGLTDRAPLMLVMTLRLDLDGSGRGIRAAVLEDFPHRMTDMPLLPLDTQDARALADHLAPEVGLDEASCETIVNLAEGNPLYIEELVTALIEGGELVRQRTWTLSSRTEDLLPPALESLLVARIDRLKEGARRLAQIAAVIGRTFRVDVLREVAEGPDLDADLAELLRAQIVREVRRFPTLECTFKHGLVQEAAFSSLTPQRRRELYGRVAAVFEHLDGANRDEHLPLLAFYYYRSDDRAKALEYLEAAAKRAEQLDPDQAAELWARARKVAAKVSDKSAVPTTSPESPAATASTETIGGFVVDEFLGDGATGTVYRATSADGEQVALKILKPELAEDQVFRRRFEHEVRAAREVDNEHLVAIRDAGEADGALYIAMEFLEGRPLNEIVERDGPLDVRGTVRVVLQVGAALDALHGRDIVHRDVKPSNIVLAERGAVLTDLGLAKGRAYTVLTRPGQVLGTLDYMAPEIIKGEEAGPASDIYALACVAYECITGRPPFADKGVFQVGKAHVVDEPPDASAARSDIPKEFGWAISQALAKDPARRPPSGIAFANLLKMAAKS